MSGYPILTGPTVIEDRTLPAPTFDFSCNIQYVPTGSNDTAVFLVTFLFDGKVDTYVNETEKIFGVPTFTVFLPDLHAELSGKYIRGRLGKSVSSFHIIIHV